MIDISEIIDDADFARNYQVKRQKGEFDCGEFVITDTSIIDEFGPVVPYNDENIEYTPNGDIISGDKIFYSKNPFYTTKNKNDTESAYLSDILIYKNETFVIVAVKDLSEWGCYKAVASREKPL